MSVIIRLQGLPWSASAMDIRNFFKGLSIPPGGVRIIGGENGDAFIAFSTDEDARQAMMHNNGLLNDCQVQLFLSSKTEMQNTITQAKVKAPVVPGTSPVTQAPTTTPVSSNVGISLNQIPSVQQISQAFPAVGQIIGQLGLQQPSQMSQFPSGLQTDRHQPTQPAGFFNNSNMTSVRTANDSFINNRYEQELPGEYAVGGMQNMNNTFGEGSNTQRQYDHVKNPASNDRGFPQAHQSFENTSSKDQFRGEVYFPPPTVSFENNYGQQNMNQNNQGRPFGNKQGLPFQPGDFSVHAGHGKAFNNGQGSNSQQFGHGKPFNNDQGSNSQQFGHGKPFNNDQGSNSQQFGHGKPFNSDQGDNIQQFGQGKLFQTNVSMNDKQPYQSDTLQQTTHQPSGYRMPIRGQTNPVESNYSPKNRPSRFGPSIQPNDYNAPPNSRQVETSFAKPSQSSNQYSSPSPVKATPDRLTEAREKFNPVKLSSDDKTNIPPGGLILSNKRDEFGRNVPYSLRDGNLIESSRTPTQDEKNDDNRSTDSRSKDSSRRSSHSRDRSRDRSTRRDSPRDRDRRDRERDRGKRERDDDRRPRRDREREKDRDRKQRDRDNERYDRNRESKDTDRKKSPLNEANRKARKRSLSPSSRNKSDNEKKQLIEKPEQLTVQEKLEDAKSKPKTASATPISVSRGPLITDKPLVTTEKEKKSGAGIPPVFPVITPQNTGKGLLGEAPASMAPLTSTGMVSLNAPQSLLNNVNVPSKIGFRHEGQGPGSHGHAPGQGRVPLLPTTGIEKIPPGRSGGQALLDLPETFEYDHSDSGIAESNRDMPFHSRSDLRGPRDEQMNVNAPPDFRGPGRDMPPLSLMEEQQRPGFNAGHRSRLDGQRPLNARQNDAPFPIPHDFRGPRGPGGPPGRNMPPHGPDRGIYAERSRDREFYGPEGRRSLLGDGGAPRDFQGYPGRDGFQDNHIYDETGPSNFPGSQHDERFESDFGEFEGPFNDLRMEDVRRMPSLLDDIPFGDRRDFQGRQERDIPRGRDDHLSDLRDGSIYEGRYELGSDRRNMSGSQFRDDRAHGNVGGFGDFRGRGRGDRGEREFWGPKERGRGHQRQDFDRMPGHMRDTDMGPENSFDSYREDDRKTINSARDRERRPFDKADPSVGGFEKRERHDRYHENNRDRPNERTREERNKRDDRKSSRTDDRSGDKKYSSVNVKTETKSKQVDNKKEKTKGGKDSESEQDKTENDVPKGMALCSVVLENIPVETTYKDIRKLFSGLELPKDGIKIINDKDGKRIGKAYVRFGSQESFKKGLQKDKTRLGHKFIVIKPVSKKEFDTAVDSYLPPSEDDDDDVAPDLDMCNSLSATLRALKGEPALQFVKKGSPSTSKNFVVKLTLLPEYTKVPNIQRFFQGLNIAQNGDAVYIEPGQFDKPCSGLCYVEFADENSFKKALSQKKIFEKKTINITQGNKNDADNLKNKLVKKDTEIEKKSSKQSRKNDVTSDKSDHKSESKQGETKNTSQSNDSVKPLGENKDSSAGSMKSACTCLRVQNIPKGTKVFELRSLFESVGVSVKVAQICHDAVGKPIGEGYVDLPTFSDVQKCLVKDKTYFGKNKITVEPVTKTEMIENMRLLRQSLQPETPTTKAVYFFVKAANCPKTVSTGEIMNFFSGFNPAPESIRLNIGDGNEPHDCSTALVGFRTREEAETAITATNGNLLRNKNIVLTKVIL